jgi:RNA polymerase sigma factor (sigma-70 family)
MGESDPDALDRLLPLVYDEIHAMAHRQLAGERSGHTLSTTALVHEAYFRLVDDTRVTRKGRAYFFAAAARAMRQVRVAAEIAVARFADELIDLNRALNELERLNARHARVVECRFFAGLDVAETAEMLGVSPRTVKYDWALARAWLYDRLS